MTIKKRRVLAHPLPIRGAIWLAGVASLFGCSSRTQSSSYETGDAGIHGANDAAAQMPVETTDGVMPDSGTVTSSSDVTSSSAVTSSPAVTSSSDVSSSAVVTSSPDEVDPDSGVEPMSCDEGFFDDEGQCAAWTDCRPGEFVSGAGTAESDRQCAACDDGAFSSDENQAACETFTPCAPGEYISQAGDSAHDQQCTACASDTWSSTVDATECQPMTACAAGSVQTEAGSATAAPACQACSAGQYCQGGETAAVACSVGMWDHDADAATQCVAKTTCVAGEFVASEGDTVTDRTCAACESGSLSTTENAVACQAATACVAGTTQTEAGTATSEPTCQACQPGQYCEGGNAASVACATGTWDHDADAATQCVPNTECVAGEYVASEGDAVTDRVCSACGTGMWDHDADATTQCVAKITCVAGEYVASEGDAVTDRTCAACESGFFSTDENVAQCVAWASCSAGEYVTDSGSSTSDRSCEACASGSFSDAENATACAPWDDCEPGQYQSEESSAASNRICSACDSGQYSTTVNAVACANWSDCAAGTYVSNTPSVDEDRVCSTCDAGSYTADANQASCMDGTCAAGTYQTAAGSTTTAASCQACSAGEYCAGDEAPQVVCAVNTYDDDADPATACVDQLTCTSGEYVTAAGSTTQNRTCAPCTDGYTDTDNAESCQPWTVCTANEYMVSEGTPSSDRICSSTYRVSVASDGTQSNIGSYEPDLSADGRYVAFNSDANNLVADDTNNTSDIFVHDTLTQETVLVSIAGDGRQTDGYSYSAQVSGDGSYVVFTSDASNLVTGDTNGYSDIFVHKTFTGETTRVSVASDGSQANNYSYSPAISDDGRFVAFESYATNLVAGDTNGQTDIFVHDNVTGDTVRVSVATDGSQGIGYSYSPDISSDGHYVVFNSDASNLVAGDTNGYTDIFVRDMWLGQTTRVNVASDGTQANSYSYSMAIASELPIVAFSSEATNLVADDTNVASDIFVHDMQTGDTIRVSVATDGTQSNSYSDTPSVSADGHYVSFMSYASNFDPDDTNNEWDVFVHDTQTGETTRATTAPGGGAANGMSYYSSLSADGKSVAYMSYANNLVLNDTNASWDIFITHLP